MNIREKITSTFAYKAEWLQQDMFSLYTEPAYFPEITGPENCLLIGGRGTGKTTVLKGLSYLGQESISKVRAIEDWAFYGMYYKVDSSRVSAFSGLNQSELEWKRPFSHYINLIVISLAIDLIDWFCEKQGIVFEVVSNQWTKFRGSLLLEEFTSIKQLGEVIDLEISKFERYINNISHNKDYQFSLLGAPIDFLFESLSLSNVFSKKRFYIIIDEFENFSDYQQQILNTIIKEAAGKSFCFKVGVRELGWRNRLTLNDQELRSPRDYRKIDIKEKLKGNFRSFAEKICNDRITHLFSKSNPSLNIHKLLPSLTIEDEAIALGVEKKVKSAKADFHLVQALEDKTPLFKWFMIKWAEDHNMLFKEVILDYLRDNKKWDSRYENYKYATLFTINSGKGAEIKKYYCGWSTFILIAATNITFVLQLVETCLIEHINNQNNAENISFISPEVQTVAATKVAKSNFDELEGIGVNGTHIMLLIQGLGRIFEIFAKSLIYAPEINNFWIVDRPDVNVNEQTSVMKLLNLSVSHLALQRDIANKLESDDPRTYDFSIHPIYCPLFVFSHRKKRKARISSSDIIGLITNQARVVNKITLPNIEKKRLAKSRTELDVNIRADKHVKGSSTENEQLSLF